ncbi:NAD-dependent succinate-semialdehyde dehydrogenase [Salinibius halmophilus]|uniref:NAD-dependent succinate-semialdehyde dehydrogenase n=1 Tax=Salinibius halmophilus TaxID=1853216 RepID=UPI000E66A53A|nr:NAD-dependent succinate-semialdehyde dehydrogenase [Salinibius halmophilus]
MLKAVNPATEEVVRQVATATTDEVEAILAKAQAAQSHWQAIGFSGRAEILHKAAAHLREHKERYALLMTEEMGKPIKEAYGEVEKAAWCAEHYAEHAEAYLADEVIESDATSSYVSYEPLGIVLGILPWNAPFWLAFRYCAPTLMAGNTCLLKHDPHVPGCGEAIGQLFEEIGAPANILQNLPLATPDVEPVIRDPRVQAVSYTGSERGGGQVASIAASEIKHSVLELGGSDPVLVLDDADLETAADIICLSRIINAGQSCIAAKRVIVEAGVYDQFIELLKTRLAKLKLGDPTLATTDIGPIARADLRDNLHRQVQETIAAGARCLLGGELPSGTGYFYPVTLLVDVEEGMVGACEETFGPIAVVMKAKDSDHALSIANNTPYGLAASVWGSTNRALPIAKQLQSGQVAINGIVKTDPRLPSGGIKRSGIGRELGPHGIKEFVNAKQYWVGPKIN